MYTITINKEKNQFELPLDSELAYLEYLWEGKYMVLHHTFVPEILRGKGLADQLAKYALEYLEANNLKGIVTCPFVTAYLKRNPQYNHLVTLRAKEKN